MPRSVVEVRRPYAAHEEALMMAAVHEALVAAFGTPADDRSVRFVEHPPERFSYPPGLADPERHTLVTIEVYPGRTVEKKQRLYAEVAERFAVVGIPADHLTVILHEVPPESWGPAV
jgi:phenylpyruvate tautomerase PptA (4-oxalocrotonate tautomerase family)